MRTEKKGTAGNIMTKFLLMLVFLIAGCGKSTDPTITGTWYRYNDDAKTKIYKEVYSENGLFQSSLYKKDGSELSSGVKIITAAGTYTFDGKTTSFTSTSAGGTEYKSTETVKNLTADLLEYEGREPFTRVNPQQ